MIITVTFNTSIDRTLQVDDFRPGGVLKGQLLRWQPAGKGVNVSRCLAALGHESIVTGFVGEDQQSLFERSFDGTPATCDFVAVPGRTRENTTIIDPVNGTETHVRTDGFEVNDDHVSRLLETLAHHAEPGAMIVFAGSLPPGMRPEGLAELVRLANRLQCRAFVDAAGPVLRAAVREDLYAIKPNVRELEELVGWSVVSDDELLRAGRALRDHIHVILVSRGSEGGVALGDDGAWSAQCPAVDVVNTVGCGDAFVAGFLAGQAEGRPLAASLALAVACGSANATSPVAGDIDPDKVRALENAAAVRTLSP